MAALLRTALLASTLLAQAACGSVTPPAAPTLAQAVEAPRATTTGLDPALLRAALDDAGRLPQLNALIVARDGRVLAERVYDGPALDTPVNIKSASKSVIAALAGIAIARGELTGLDQPIAPLLGPRVPAGAEPQVNAITIEHLLSMRAGLQSTSGPNYGAWVSSRDWIADALGRPFVDRPGGRMIYSTGTSHILSATLARATGRTTLQLAREWLGEPLGITIPSWPADPQGTYFGGNEMRLSPRALFRFGELYRNDGVVAGRRLLPECWVQASWTPRATSPWSGGSYGLGWWIGQARGHPIYYAWGYGGQMVYVVPSLRLTAVMTSDAVQRSVDGHIQALHALLADRLIPAAERGAGGASTA